MEENQIGRQIAENRRAKGLTQEQLAEEFGVSPQAVSKWENGASCPDILILPQLADFFGITVDELLRGPRGSNCPSRWCASACKSDCRSPRWGRTPPSRIWTSTKSLIWWSRGSSAAW